MRTTAVGTIGVEVTDLDLEQPLSAEVEEELRELLDAHHLLVFQQPGLSLEAHVRLVSCFGPVRTQPNGRVDAYVSNVREDATPALREGALAFHSDYAFTENPLQAISLYAMEASEESTSTRFADGVRAARRVDDRLRASVEGRQARHLFDPADVAGTNAPGLRLGGATMPDGAQSASHPVLLRHPRTGEEVLYVSEAQTVGIEGLPDEVARRVLGALFDLLYEDANTSALGWREGQLALWDNLCLQHARGEVGRTSARTLRRLVIGVGGQAGPYGYG